YDVFEEHDVVGGAQKGRKPKVNFALASGSYFVMMHLRLDPDRLQVLDDVRPEIVKRVDRRHRNISFLMSHPVAEVFVLASRVPDAFRGLKVITGSVDLILIADIVEDEEFGFGAEVAVVGDAGEAQVSFGALSDGSRVHFISVSGDRIDGIAKQAECGF